MGFNIYFQRTKYQKNHSDTFSAMLYFMDSSFSHMASYVTPRCVCGDIYMERSTYAHRQKFPPNAESTQETDGQEKEGEKWEGREDRGSTGREYTPMQDATRQGKILSFFLLKRKESCCKKKRRRGERGEGGVFDFFQRYYKLSECSCSYMHQPRDVSNLRSSNLIAMSS